MSVIIKTARTTEELEQLHAMFAVVFASEPSPAQTPDNYEELLGKSDICVLLACAAEEIVGGLVAYELPLLSGEREFYLYDIAVRADHQKQGIGTKLIQALKKEAQARRITTIFVEAEAKDTGAVKFYRSFGEEEIEVRHFNLRGSY